MFDVAVVQTAVGAKLVRRSSLSIVRCVACSANAIVVSAYHRDGSRWFPKEIHLNARV
jgi:hypothetical protein